MWTDKEKGRVVGTLAQARASNWAWALGIN